MPKFALITGASRGIGEAITLSLARKNYRLALVATDAKRLKAIAHLCQLTDILQITADLSQPDNCQKIIEQVADRFGSLDLLVNNAGLCYEGNIEDADLSRWDAAINVNLTSVIHLTKHALPLLKKGVANNGQATVVNIGSIAGQKTYRGGANYCATKWALLGFAGSLFEDVRDHQIKVCTICPGYVNTDIHRDNDKLRKPAMIQPEDIADTLNYVLSTPPRLCPTEITLMPQIDPRGRK